MSPLLKERNTHCASFEFATRWTHCRHFIHTHQCQKERRFNKHFLSTYTAEASRKSFSPMKTHHKPHFTDTQTKAQKSLTTGPRSHNTYMAGLGFKPKSPLFSFRPWQTEGWSRESHCIGVDTAHGHMHTHVLQKIMCDLHKSDGSLRGK